MKFDIKWKTGKNETLIKYSAACALILVVSMICGLFSAFGSAHIDFSTYSETALEGRNPDGTALNAHEIMSDEVLERASEKLGGRISAKELKRHLSVDDDWTYEETVEFKNGIAQGTGKQHENPSKFTLTYSTISEKIENEGFFSCMGASLSQIIKPSKGKTLRAVTESYQEYYEEKHCLNPAILERDISYVKGLDYYNRVEAIEDIAGDINRLITEKYDKYVDFVSPTLGVGFGDLANEIDKIIDVDIENYRAYVVEHAVSENPEELLMQFKYMRDLYEEEMIRKDAEADINKTAVGVYDSRITKVVFIPALDAADEFYMNRTKVGIDYLIQHGEDARVEARAAESNMEKYKYLIEKFEGSVTSREESEKGEVMYKEIETKLMAVQEKAMVLFDETNRDRYYSGIEPSGVYRNSFMSFAKTTVKNFVVITIMAYLALIAVKFVMKKMKDKDQAEGKENDKEEVTV